MDFYRKQQHFNAIQAGFRKKHSTETAIEYVIENWRRSLGKNKIIIAVFLDFKKAFETFDRNRLLKKIEN